MQALLSSIELLAQQAGAAIMAIYQADDFASAAAVQQKADCSPLTAADLAAQRIISAGLAELTPQWPQLSEEAALTPWQLRQQWQRYWLIDPLDGSKEFIQRNGEFTVNIALIDHGAPVLGVVYAPALGKLYSADVQAKQAYCNGHAIHTQPQLCANSPLRILVSRSHRSAADSITEDNTTEHRFIPMGSSLKFCLIAEGNADIYRRIGPTSEWDTAAGHALLVAAGGSVCTLDGQPLRYNQKPELLNPHFIARA
ncbi:MAG: 3'(2'),5'-bisphosphate nucleotidase CysQ [Pseudidiomarina mangrovi]|nr:MAG: 3'(2'),5'-bisphosphate nucleotidase CysQ [Pseudidiomarina mangrovi]